jgi:acetyl esterase
MTATEPALERAVAHFEAAWDTAVFGSVAERRAQLAAHMTRRMATLSWPGGWSREVELRELVVDPAGRAVRVRAFVPRDVVGPLPVLVYMFGGGWWLRNESAPDVFQLCTRMAVEGRAVVVQVDYALAPERPFPHGLDDVDAVLRWIRSGASGLPVDGSPIVVGGASAGANLAAAACLRLRDRGETGIALQVLEVPVVDPGRHADPFVGQYIGAHPVEDPLISPLRAESHEGLPPALILVAEFDRFAPEGREFGNALRAAGVDAVTVSFDGQAHLTPSLWPLTTASRAWRRLVASELRALANGGR